MRFLDSNVFLRYITRDDDVAQQACADLFARIQNGLEDAFTTDVHIHETCYVLASKALYGLSHGDIRDRLRPLLLLNGLKMGDKKVCLDALDIFATHPFLDFADALAVASMKRQGIQEIYSFDRDFRRVPDITRIDPADA